MHFNSQPREGGWRKARTTGTNTGTFQLTAARRRLGSTRAVQEQYKNFNSQPREGGWKTEKMNISHLENFNSQPREGGWFVNAECTRKVQEFQLTAARRRLAITFLSAVWICNFNSQPREGGWTAGGCFPALRSRFQLTAARRRLVRAIVRHIKWLEFQLTAARRRLAVYL